MKLKVIGGKGIEIGRVLYKVGDEFETDENHGNRLLHDYPKKYAVAEKPKETPKPFVKKED
jgi:hypothetical protein